MQNTNAVGVIDSIVAPAIPVASCVSWERSHASTRVASTGGVRPLTLTGQRRRDLALGSLTGMDAPAYTSFPSSGTSTSSPPV